jgi:hypothetical protein
MLILKDATRLPPTVPPGTGKPASRGDRVASIARTTQLATSAESTEEETVEGHTLQLSIRLPRRLLARVEMYRQQLLAQRPWVPVTRATCLRHLLAAGLNATMNVDAPCSTDEPSTGNGSRQS